MNGRTNALALAMAATFLACSSSAIAADTTAAETLARKSNCLKCHAIDKKKSAPSYREISAKYKGDSSAEEKLFQHLTTNPLVEIDGEKEEHTSLKTKNEADIRSVVQWILSL